jgi:tRNA (guanine-N7-)-methyltransferase
MSFGLGRGRQLETGAWGLAQDDLPPHDQGSFDPHSLFPVTKSRLEIEIGAGKGTFLVQQSSLQPETNFLGIEWAGEFYRYAADRLRRRELHNVRVLHANATEFIRFWCPDSCTSVVHLYYSDPWPKKRHHKRRVLQSESLEQFHRILEPDGEIHLVTDHAELWAWYEELVGANQKMFSREEFSPPQSAQEGEFVGTNFERKYQAEKRSVSAMTLRRLG